MWNYKYIDDCDCRKTVNGRALSTNELHDGYELAIRNEDVTLEIDVHCYVVYVFHDQISKPILLATFFGEI